MRKTDAGEKIKELKAEAAELEKEAAALRRIRRMEPGAREREREAARLREMADGMKGQARLEDLSVYQVAKEKHTKNVEIIPPSVGCSVKWPRIPTQTNVE